MVVETENNESRYMLYVRGRKTVKCSPGPSGALQDDLLLGMY